MARTEVQPLGGMVRFAVALRLEVSGEDETLVRIGVYAAEGERMTPPDPNALLAEAEFVLVPSQLVAGTTVTAPAVARIGGESCGQVESSSAVLLRTASSGVLHITESLVVSQYCFDIPFQLALLLLDEAVSAFELEIDGAVKVINGAVASRGELPAGVVERVQATRDRVLTLANYLEQGQKHPLQTSVQFKPSTLKSAPELALVPTNLHVQSMEVVSDDGGCETTVTTTVGAFAAHIYGFKTGGIRQMLEGTPKAVTRLRVASRRDVAWSQALTAAITSFAQHLEWAVAKNSGAMGLAALQQLEALGFLFQVESLLSTQGKELGMLGDMDDAIRALAGVTFVVQLKGVSASVEERCRGQGGAVVLEVSRSCGGSSLGRSEPRVGLNLDVVLQIEVDARVLGGIGGGLEAGGGVLRVETVPVLFTQGINEMQTMANLLGGSKLQEDINAESLSRLQSFYSRWVKYHFGGEATSVAMRVLPELSEINASMQGLADEVQSSRSEKNAQILTRAADLTRTLLGGRVTVCKSAKDRTSMSVTFEQSRVLQQKHALVDGVTPETLMRAHGVRRDNAFLNIGRHSYAFNALQTFLLPSAYKPPSGTGGALVS
ncbi:type I inositol-3,4-bisphosphate 4-phosphatase [Thecamonas trahens ATCC 50062]|uniref:Type I inositol-3,4-bisphosphate 4-phosphatase n=1 Tax=Thecamonas trahens ATCC 50062 TaxID=461836 RepID=A0A0L0D8M8_THETB|nr:type I inositol-3,4-bisphosphate 4-phosphatase [Thecamonas trahens ATCC 50062]KNC48704.1 type I inositol-3,4-bisphosphate 4-phosphatase [Thecamonas trahens ATCC 50062]|eukprot:XP_013762760.1 type I inositol-3,4-bisphosphate 4-phosphatase [Thecamonas trahens ATCC 50062]